MAFIRIIGVFDDPAAVERAQSALFEGGLATGNTMRVERPLPGGERHRPESARGLWQRIRHLLKEEPDELTEIYAEAVRRGSLLLIVEVPEERADQVTQILRQNGAVDLRARVEWWKTSGWTGFGSVAAPSAEEQRDEGLACIPQEAASGEQQPRTVRLFDEGTGREIGRISEAELKVLRDALEEEGPDDNDYWINPDEIDSLACRPGATKHLIALLRRAVGDNPDGIDIAFQREGQARQSLREPGAGTARGGE